MGWRILQITKPCKLSVKNRQLLYEPQEGDSIKLPLEDISVVILENRQILLSSSLLSELANMMWFYFLAMPVICRPERFFHIITIAAMPKFLGRKLKPVSHLKSECGKKWLKQKSIIRQQYCKHWI